MELIWNYVWNLFFWKWFLFWKMFCKFDLNVLNQKVDRRSRIPEIGWAGVLSHCDTCRLSIWLKLVILASRRAGATASRTLWFVQDDGPKRRAPLNGYVWVSRNNIRENIRAKLRRLCPTVLLSGSAHITISVVYSYFEITNLNNE